ncbi:MAG: EAL domain-containing protein, partial [Granulosicoccus sp.]|nr:EAL domain-containing protein [Granulosicoccus sp.]
DIRTNMTSGMEALIRWNSKTLGRVSPAEFIPQAEKSGLIVELGDWVLRKAIEDYLVLTGVGMSPGALSVNISRRQFDNPNLVANIEKTINDTGMTPELLTLEITETAILDNRAHAEEVLYTLSGLGVNLSIDDFGVGYSSFLELRDFPVNEVKIDRMFIKDVVGCQNSRKIIQAIVNVAEAIGAEVVAEGIENREQFECIRALGCDRAQGFFLCEPMTATTFPDVVLGGGNLSPA